MAVWRKSQTDDRRTPAKGTRRLDSHPGRARRVGRAGLESPTMTPRATRPGRSYFCKEVSMFEAQSQAELDALIQGNSEFKQLYRRHKELDKKVLDAEL